MKDDRARRGATGPALQRKKMRSAWAVYIYIYIYIYICIYIYMDI